ncbi:alpha/beta fold hydrolase [Acidisphaera sp. S103]|uniref:alpha/beta fold hydrolase n=1 Tax=Acidisphaera sp. S103 TaxID=1747223 RepID=UPI00131C4FF6|nr:alpha/beta fold hydrolase [Acidisphaera sp. S103]
MSFTERFVDADGFRIRYMEAGQGPALIHLHGAGGLHMTPAHDLLSRDRRVIAFEMPGFGDSAENTQSDGMEALASTMAAAVRALGIEVFDLLGSSFGAKVALWLAARHPNMVRALVLEGPAAIRPGGMRPPSGTAAEMAPFLFGHPDRVAPMPDPDPTVAAKQRRLVGRLRGPDQDAALEDRMRGLAVPVLVLFGTLDRVMPPEMGREYKALLPNSHLVFVYDAGHLIAAERPEAFAEVVGDFLARREAFVITRRETMIFP